MSTAVPSIAVVFGAVTPPQADVVELLVHLGCSKEVSSYDITLHNHDGKYSPNGAYPITVGMDGSISLGRTPNCPLLMTVRVEKVHYQSSPTESYLIVSGRCWGERLFRRVVTATYSGMKGEEIVKDLMDYYAGLSHNRSGTELVETTDTTYSELEYEDSPVWDILKYVAESSDKSGLIGFDFRVAPDGKFEFFPKLSKTNSTVITENIDTTAEYEKEITRIRNKVTVYGLADKSSPADKVSWTRQLAPTDGTWTGSAGNVSVDGSGAPDGGACIKLYAPNNYYGSANFTLNAGYLLNCEQYPILALMLKAEATFGGTGTITLYDNTYKTAQKEFSISPDAAWHSIETGVGSTYVNQWKYIDSGFDWTQILCVRITLWYPGTVATGSFWIHQLYIGGRRYSGIAENAASQAAYGLREYVEVDEELWSDTECSRRAAALLAYLKDPAEYLHIISAVLDYGVSPVKAGDKVHVELPTEGVNSDFRVESIEYRVPKDVPTQLEITLVLGKEPPQLADYLYGLRTHTPNVEKLSRTKLGKRGVPVASGGGDGGSSGSYFNSNAEIDKASPCLNLMTSRTLKAAFGFDGANVFVVTYAGDLILYSANHLIRPITDGSDDLGNGSFRFGSAYLKNNLFVAGWEVVANTGRINMWSMPRDTSGFVLEAQGAGNYPMYVDPNGRYSPAAHNHANMYPAGGNNTGACGDTSNYWHVVAGDSVWYNALGHMDIIDDLAAIKKIKQSQTNDERGVPLIDVDSLPEEVRSKEGMIHGGHLMGLALGAIKQLNAKVEALERELEQLQGDGLK